ncbi:hypothetical protein THAOC_20277 [Thalassiosira oceanica]|uniref:Uncharacterized protein n=1 Tax=Thalassiosira oceanica TaxID=159749 RepID=K0SEW6_THAOC|nr:hypothetical protein THAOC_20277 [Thalassiosira oceanica]|eukprot:EJK59491.1 hypothetical protein THAOC_20277 [Thalassiosira oceanica]
MDQSQVNELLADDLCFNVSVFRLQLCRTDSSDCELEDVDLVQFLVCQEKLDEELEDSDKKIAASIPGSDEHDAAVKEKTAINALKYRVELSASNKGKGVPTATELLAELDAREDVDYVVLKGSYDEALDKVRINKQRRKKKGGKVELNESCEVKDLGEEADDSVKNVVKGLSLGNGGVSQ